MFGCLFIALAESYVSLILVCLKWKKILNKSHSVGSYVTYIHFCAFGLLKLIFHLILTQNIMKIKKKGIAFFYQSRKCPKWRNPRWPPTYIKINILTNNFATTYARDINNMSIIMFPGMRKPIISFVFRKKYCKVYIYANISKKRPDIAVKLRLTLFWLIVFFCFDYAWLVPLRWYLDGWGALKNHFQKHSKHTLFLISFFFDIYSEKG